MTKLVTSTKAQNDSVACRILEVKPSFGSVIDLLNEIVYVLRVLISYWRAEHRSILHCG